MCFSSEYNFDFNGMMPVPLKQGTHMIENYIHHVFAFEFNHVGFITLNVRIS